ncbi:MAG TPA: electron transport complex subunit RsxC, partial [Gammaproteobacteria bacterium]|nr:electron transport complex subunit RsxC [Gammaproteobacteria bacterium]
MTGQPYWTFRGGIHPPQHKTESTLRPVEQAPVPRRLILPLHQHIGAPAKPVVERGERVLRGQVIARASDFVSAPVHASSSGTVVDI